MSNSGRIGILIALSAILFACHCLFSPTEEVKRQASLTSSTIGTTTLTRIGMFDEDGEALSSVDEKRAGAKGVGIKQSTSPKQSELPSEEKSAVVTGAEDQDRSSAGSSSSASSSFSLSFPPLQWPPEARWDASQNQGRPAPLLFKDDNVPIIANGGGGGGGPTLERYEWDHAESIVLSDGGGKEDTRPSSSSSSSSTHPTAAITVRYGILAVPTLLCSRVLPLLNTSMRHADAVDVFLRKTAYSHALVEYINAFVRSPLVNHPNPSAVRVIEVLGPTNDLISKPWNIRNAWMDLEVMRHWGAELRAAEGEGAAAAHHRWYCIIDDDGYALTANVKAMLAAEEAAQLANNAKGIAELAKSTPPYNGLPLPMVVGSMHVYRKKKFQRAFLAGGPGIFFNEASLYLSTREAHFKMCETTHIYGGGDIRASFCMADVLGCVVVPIEHSYFDSPMRAVGEAKKPSVSPFPVSFHRMRERMWGYRLAAVEEARRKRGGSSTASSSALVSWNDIATNFNSNTFPHLFFPSQFFPREYDNFTMLYFAMTKESLALYNKKRKRPLNADPM